MSQLTNTTLNQKELVIDEEFRKLIPKLTNEENEQLETSIKEDKCRDSIITWNGTIIDGHNRYDICKKNNIDFDTVSKDFKDREEVKLWIIDNQLGRRNLTKYDRSVLALKKKDIIAANAKNNQGARTDISQKSVKSVDTQKKLAKDAGVSHDTIYKVEVIERSATEEQKNKIRNQTSTINKIFKDIARQEKREKFRRENAKRVEQYVEDDSIRIIHGDFYDECKKFKKNSVDLIITDPPYPKEFIHVWGQLGETAGRLLKPSGFLVSYSGHMHLDRVMHDLGQHLNFYWILSLLHSGATQLVNPRNVIAEFKPILVYQKPPFKKLEGRPLRDVITKDNRDKDFHEWGQGELGVEILMNHFSKPNDLVLDPFVGGGTTLSVAKKLKRRAIGIDIDEECIATTKSRLVKNHYGKGKKYKPVIMEKLGIKEEDLRKPEQVPEAKGNRGDFVEQFQDAIEELLPTDGKSAADIMSVHVPVKDQISKEDITIEWKIDRDDPDHSGSPSSPQICNPDDYDGEQDKSYNLGVLNTQLPLLIPEKCTDISPHLNKIILGDCLDKLKGIPDNSVDLIVTDPPYGMKYMRKDWDKVIPSVEIWKEALRVLKPGAIAFIMSIPRQDLQSRMIVNLEDAGFKINFSPLYWTYANGFTKAHNIKKALNRKFGAEIIKNKQLEGAYRAFQPKPAVELILVAMKSLDKNTYLDQALKNGKGITWLDDCRIPYQSSNDKDQVKKCFNVNGKHETGLTGGGKKVLDNNFSDKGRLPSNLLISDNVLDDGRRRVGGLGFSDFFSLDTWTDKNLKNFPFLIVPKASKKEKNAGLEDFQEKTVNDGSGNPVDNPFQRGKSLRKNTQPTIKPINLMGYLIMLGSREGDLVLDPFAGSGTTCIAAKYLKRKFIGIELKEEYQEIAEERIKNVALSMAA